MNQDRSTDLRPPRAALIVNFDWFSGRWSVSVRDVLTRGAEKLLDGQRRLMRMVRARAAQPNNLGNYRGKRFARSSPASLAPAERFDRLRSHYLSCAMTYRNPAAADGRDGYLARTPAIEHAK